MNLTVDRLRKVLELERARGYRDEAVMGGLDRLLCNVATADPGLTRLLSRSYATLDAREREEGVAC